MTCQLRKRIPLAISYFTLKRNEEVKKINVFFYEMKKKDCKYVLQALSGILIKENVVPFRSLSMEVRRIVADWRRLVDKSLWTDPIHGLLGWSFLGVQSHMLKCEGFVELTLVRCLVPGCSWMETTRMSQINDLIEEQTCKYLNSYHKFGCAMNGRSDLTMVHSNTNRIVGRQWMELARHFVRVDLVQSMGDEWLAARWMAYCLRKWLISPGRLAMV